MSALIENQHYIILLAFPNEPNEYNNIIPGSNW